MLLKTCDLRTAVSSEHVSVAASINSLRKCLGECNPNITFASYL